MMSAIDKAKQLARKAQEQLYDCMATIYTQKDTIDVVTGIATAGDVTSDEYPCRVSYKSKSLQSADSSGGIAEYPQSITLFINPDAEIIAGADIDVVQRDRTMHFKSAGIPAVYASHQEVPLKNRSVHRG